MCIVCASKMQSCQRCKEKAMYFFFLQRYAKSQIGKRGWETMIGHHGITGQQDAVERWIIIHSQKQPRVNVRDLLHSATLFFQNSFHFILFLSQGGGGEGKAVVVVKLTFSLCLRACLSRSRH